MEQLVSMPWGLPTPPATPVSIVKTGFFIEAKTTSSEAFHCATEEDVLSMAAELAAFNVLGLQNTKSDPTIVDGNDGTPHWKKSGPVVPINSARRTQMMDDSAEPAETWYGMSEKSPMSKMSRVGVRDEPRGTKTSERDQLLEINDSDSEEDWVGKGADFWERLIHEPIDRAT